MKFFTFGCICGCKDPMIGCDDNGMEFIPMYRTREQAQLAIADLAPYERPLIVEVETTML